MSSIAPRPSARPSPSDSSTPDEDRGLTPVFARAAPFALFIAFIALQSLLETFADARWIVALRGVAVAALLAWFWRDYTELTEAPGLTARQWAIAVATGAVAFAAWLAFDSGWAAFDAGKPFVPTRADGSLDPTLVALRLFGLVAVVPVMEELFWRSFVMRWISGCNFLALDPRRVSVLAIVVSSALFASEHALWFAGLLAGLIYALVFVGIGNLRAALVSHATTNGLLGGWILATRDWRFW